MKYQFLCFLIIILFSSCSSTILIKKNDASLRELNNELKGKSVTIELISGEQINSSNVKIHTDSTKINRKKICTKNIHKITNTSKTEGLLYGMTLGCLSGALFGTLAGTLVGETEESGFFGGTHKVSAEANIGRWGIGMALVGVLSGGLIGGISGDKEVYQFPYAYPPAPDTPSRIVEKIDIVERRGNSIIVNWKNKQVQLYRSEYFNAGVTKNGDRYLKTTEEAYLEKFKL